MVASAVPVAAPVAVPAPPPAAVAAPAQAALAAPAPSTGRKAGGCCSTVPMPVRCQYQCRQLPWQCRRGPWRPSACVAPLDYTLDAGDKLRVVVFGQEGLTNTYASTLAVLSIAADRLGAGARTDPRGAGLRIAAKLRNGYIREPPVAVEVVVYRPFFILGEVTAPGQYPYVPSMTAEPRSPSPAGSRRAPAAKPDPHRPVAGRIVRMSVPPASRSVPATPSGARALVLMSIAAAFKLRSRALPELKARTGFAGPGMHECRRFNARLFFQLFGRKASERCQAIFADACRSCPLVAMEAVLRAGIDVISQSGRAFA